MGPFKCLWPPGEVSSVGLLPGSSNPINRNGSNSTSQISTLVEDSNAEKGKIKNRMTRFGFEKGE